ncbi:hypothetical protein CBM2633_B10435 [Cupriavidus taiwanensis]|nr:hypothetical protein CBM2633_B10435 [Cupriavidus taiwanensis]
MPGAAARAVERAAQRSLPDHRYMTFAFNILYPLGVDSTASCFLPPKRGLPSQVAANFALDCIDRFAIVNCIQNS